MAKWFCPPHSEVFHSAPNHCTHGTGVEPSRWPSGSAHNGVGTTQRAGPSGWPPDSAARTRPPWGCRSLQEGRGGAAEALADAAGSAGDARARAVGRAVPRTPWRSLPAGPRRPRRPRCHPVSSACRNARAACSALE